MEYRSSGLPPIIPLTNPVEMNADLSAVMAMMKADPVYRIFCSSIYRW
jgi:cytochrome c peroxidase